MIFNFKKWRVTYFRFTRSEYPALASLLIAWSNRLDDHPTDPYCTILTIDVEDAVKWCDEKDAWKSDDPAKQAIFDLVGSDPDILQLVVYMQHPDQHNHRCDCIQKVNESLSEKNTILATTINFAPEKNGLPVQMTRVNTTKLDTKKRVKALELTASCCPFCGKRYDWDKV